MMIQDDPALEQEIQEETLEPEEPEDQPEPEQPEPEETAAQTFQVADQELTEAELADSVRLYKILQSDPDAREAIATMDAQARESGWGSVRERLTPPPVPEVEEEDEWVDPAVRELRTEVQGLRDYVSRQARSDLERATDSGINAFFHGRDDLDEDARRNILGTARDLNLVTSQLLRFPEHQREDSAVRAEAVKRALDAAYRIEYFDSASQQATQQTVNDLNRRDRQRIPASAPTRRAAPEPKTRAERDAAIVEALRGHMEGGNA